jgi:drug/metabolite transporter (DMT)-like permease
MRYIIITAILYAGFQILAAYAAKRVSSTFFLVAGTASTVIFTSIISLFSLSELRAIGSTDGKSIILLLAANACITFFALFLAKSFQVMDARLVIPLVFGIAILVSTAISMALQGHRPTPYEIISLVLVSGGLIMFALQTGHQS